MSKILIKPKLKAPIKPDADATPLTVSKPKPKPKLLKPPKPIPKLRLQPIPEAIIESDDDLDLKFPLIDLRDKAGLTESIDSNAGLLDAINKLIDISIAQKANMSGTDKSQQQRRINSFVKARDAIKSYPKEIKSGAQAQKHIDGVGKGIATRIDEYLETGTLSEIEEAIDPRSRLIMELCTITGIGEVKAVSLIDNYQIASVEDLIEKYNTGVIKVAKNQLTHHIAVGIEYYYDLQKRIPWSEAHELAELLKSHIDELDPDLCVDVCGSYRRQRDTCGDIDVLISHPEVITDEDAESRSELETIVAHLEKVGFLVGHLTSKGKTKYMGVCKLDKDGSLGRRIDIRFVPRDSLGAAILYFTGSGKFNKMMRFVANQRGYTLNEYGIYHYINNIKGERIVAETEKDIFDIVGIFYLTPEEREF